MPDSDPQCCQDLDERVTCLETHRDTLDENQNLINERLKVVEDSVAPKSFTPGTFAFMADQGEVNANQAAAANMVLGWGFSGGQCLLDGLFLGGDNNYPDGEASTMEANFAAFSALVDEGKVFPCMGNHDLDTLTGQPLMDKFPLLFTDGVTPANRRYYHQYFERGDLDLFVIDYGRNSGYTSVEPDGKTVGSVQYQWFVNALANSTGKWKVVMAHTAEVVAMSDGPTPRYSLDLDWNWESLGIHLFLHGHTHTNTHLRSNGLNILDMSAVVRTPRQLTTGSPYFYGATTGVTSVWLDVDDPGGDYSLPAVARITAERYKLSVDVFRLDGTQVHSFVV